MTTTISKLPEDLEKRMLKKYECNLLHNRKPYATGKKYWNKDWKMWMEEIIWVCNICDNQRKNK